MCWAGGGRRQRTIPANPRKIQNSNKPHKLNFSWGREFMMQSHMQHPSKSLRFFFAIREYFQTSHINSQTYIHPAMMNFKLVILDVYVIDICQKCTLYFCSSVLDICQKCNRLRQMPVVWMRFIYNSMHFRFGNNRCCLPRQEIICLFIYCTI